MERLMLDYNSDLVLGYPLRSKPRSLIICVGGVSWKGKIVFIEAIYILETAVVKLKKSLYLL
jgi:hypothetical protein